MVERPLEQQIRELAEQIAAGPDDVAEFATIHAQTYRRERLIALGMASVDSMVNDGPEEVDESDPRLVAPRVRLRDRLRRLLAWARETGRM